MKLTDIKRKPFKGPSHTCFLDEVDMALFKREEAIRNSLVKRGEYKRSNHTVICRCGCGDPSCHFEADVTKWYEKK